jgi:hypothetical protein
MKIKTHSFYLNDFREEKIWEKSLKKFKIIWQERESKSTIWPDMNNHEVSQTINQSIEIINPDAKSLCFLFENYLSINAKEFWLMIQSELAITVSQENKHLPIQIQKFLNSLRAIWAQSYLPHFLTSLSCLFLKASEFKE